MDAESNNIGAGRRTRLHQLESGVEFGHFRSGMLEAEDRIVEDVEKLKETLSPRRIARSMVAAAGKELLRAVDRQNLGDVRERIRTGIKDHLYASAAVGLCLGGLVLHGQMNYRKYDRMDYSS